MMTMLLMIVMKEMTTMLSQQKEGIESMRCRLKAMRLELISRCRDLNNIENLCESQRSMNEIDGQFDEVYKLILVSCIVDD